MKPFLCGILTLQLLCALACPVNAERMPAPGGEPFPPVLGSEPLPPALGGEPLPSEPDSEPLPPAPGGEPLPPVPGGEPLPSEPGGEPLPPESGGEPLPSEPGGEPLPSEPGGEPLPLAPGGADPRMSWGETPCGPFQITNVFQPRQGDQTRKPLTLQEDEPLTALAGQLPQKLPCDAVDSGNLFVYYECPVNWDLPDRPAEPGRVSISGTLAPETDYSVAQGFSGKVELSVLVLGGEPEPLTQVSAAFGSIDLLTLGEAPEDGCKTEPVTCFTDYPGEYFTCPIEWDYTGVKQDIPGSYPVTGALKLPAGFALPPDLKPFTRSVVVMDDTKADLSAATFEPATNLLTCRWLYLIPEEMPVSLEYAVGRGAWKPDDQAYLRYSKYGRNSLSVYLEKLALKTDYYFRIVYGAAGAQTISNVLHVRLENWDFLDSESVAPPFDIGGDRDGGDFGGDELPDLEQPTSDSDDDDSSKFQEVVTKTSTTLSGARLRQLTAEGGTVLFEKQGVAVELSAAFLDTLKLKKTQLLEVTIERPTPDTFRLSLYANHTEINALPETTVRLPWETAGEPPECVDLSGAAVSGGTYEPESGTVRFTIRATGTYRIQPVPAAPVLLPPAAASVSAPVPVVNRPAEQLASDAQAVSEPLPVPKPVESAVAAVETVSVIPPPAEPRGWLWLVPAGALLAAAAVVFLRWRRRHE